MQASRYMRYHDSHVQSHTKAFAASTVPELCKAMSKRAEEISRQPCLANSTSIVRLVFALFVLSLQCKPLGRVCQRSLRQSGWADHSGHVIAERQAPIWLPQRQMPTSATSVIHSFSYLSARDLMAVCRVELTASPN